MSLWTNALADNPLIAILRGLQPDRAVHVADILVEAGFRIVEVPLNSPQAFASIEAIVRKHGEYTVIGAGTVLSEQDVISAVNAGGQIIVAPNMNPQVGRRALDLGTKWCPGVLTPTEALDALQRGASVLKFFPAELMPPGGISALRAVLPDEAIIAAVGGITPETMEHYHRAGSDSFGLGSALFKPEYPLNEIRSRAQAFVEAYRNLLRE